MLIARNRLHAISQKPVRGNIFELTVPLHPVPLLRASMYVQYSTGTGIQVVREVGVLTSVRTGQKAMTSL